MLYLYSMKKTKDITKYSVKWQLLRSSIKGGNTSCQDKISKVLLYYNQEKTIDAWERVCNFLEGLQKGYASSQDLDKIELIQTELDKLTTDKVLIKEISNKEVELRLLLNSSFQDRYCLYKDLFKRSKTWLVRGYFHKEQESFIDLLIQSFNLKLESSLIKDNYKYERLLKLRNDSQFIKNKHKFFF